MRPAVTKNGRRFGELDTAKFQLAKKKVTRKSKQFCRASRARSKFSIEYPDGFLTELPVA